MKSHRRFVRRGPTHLRVVAASLVMLSLVITGCSSAGSSRPTASAPGAPTSKPTCHPSIARPQDLPELDRRSLDAHQMELAQPVPQVPNGDAHARAKLAAQLDAAAGFARSVPHARDATRLGYALTLAPERGSGAHWTRWASVNCRFDPSQPSEILYDGVGPDAAIVALSYLVVHRGGPPRGFADPNAQWHQHFGLCLVHGALVDRMQCGHGGRILDGRDLWMLHAWVVPAWPNSWGIFVPLNPSRLESGVSAEPHAPHPP